MNATRSAIVATLVGAACAHGAGHTAPDPLGGIPVTWQDLGKRVREADYIVAGRLVRLEPRERYDVNCYLVAKLLGRCDRDVRAYLGKLAVDSALVGRARELWVTMFAFAGDTLPPVGVPAIWLTRRRVVYRQDSCHGGVPCDYDLNQVLDSNEDVRPLGDWPFLLALAEQTGRRGPR